MLLTNILLLPSQKRRLMPMLWLRVVKYYTGYELRLVNLLCALVMYAILLREGQVTSRPFHRLTQSAGLLQHFVFQCARPSLCCSFPSPAGASKIQYVSNSRGGGGGGCGGGEQER